MTRMHSRLDRQRSDIFERFRQRDDGMRQGAHQRVAYWKTYCATIAGLPVEIRQTGLLATLARRCREEIPTVDARPSDAVLHDLKWCAGKDTQSLKDWIEEIYRPSDNVVRMRLQQDLMDSAQALKQVAGLRLSFAKLTAGAARAEAEARAADGPDEAEGEFDEDAEAIDDDEDRE